MKRFLALAALALAVPMGGCGGDEKAISEQSCDEIVRTAGQALADHYGKGGNDQQELDRLARQVADRSKALDCPGFEATVTDLTP
jgi:hypothetical protein